MLDISDVQHLRLLAEVRSVSRAAERLNMSQPTLSKRLSRMERMLGVTLFDRSNAGMVPTAATQYILNAGLSLELQMRAIERHVRLMASVQCGEISIGVGPIVEQLYFPSLLKLYCQEFPMIRLSVRTGTAEQLEHWLREAVIDVAVGGPFDRRTLSAEFHLESLHRAPIVFVAAPEHPLLSFPRSTIEEVAAFPTVGPTLPHWMIEQLGLGGNGQQPIVACENYSIARGLARESGFITGGPEQLFSAELTAGTLRILPIDIDLNWEASFLLFPEALHLPAIKKFIEILRVVASTESRDPPLAI